MVKKPECEQFGVTEEQCNSIYEIKKKIRNYTFGIASAVGILTGCIAGIYMAKGLYETVLFILFFGCFLGSIFGALFTIIVKTLIILVLYLFSPAYRGCRQYISAIKKNRYWEY